MTEAKTSFPVVNLTPGQLVFSLFTAVMVACGLYAGLISAPAIRATAQKQLEQTIADENRAFCEKFGMRLGTSEFVECGEQLAIVRQKQIDRDSAAAQGIL